MAKRKKKVKKLPLVILVIILGLIVFLVSKTILKPKDKVKPELTLVGSDMITIIKGQEYKELGYKATDNLDGDITAKVKVDGKVDTEKDGTYELTYTIEDSSKNKDMKKRKVVVSAKSPLTMSVREFTLKGYFENTTLKETADMGDDYAESFIYAGDSTALYYVMNKVISGKLLWHKEGVNLDTIFTQDIYINHQESGMTLSEAFEKNKPEKVLLSLGTNSVAVMETDYIISQYKKLLNELKKKSPNTTLIVQSIFPVAASLDDANKALNNDKINKLNYYILELCDELDIPFLNTAEALKDSKGQLKEGYYRDTTGERGVHLSVAGNEVAMDYLKTHAYNN